MSWKLDWTWLKSKYNLYNENTKQLIINHYNTSAFIIRGKMKILQADCSLMVNRSYQTLRKYNLLPYILYIIDYILYMYIYLHIYINRLLYIMCNRYIVCVCVLMHRHINTYKHVNYVNKYINICVWVKGL